MRGHIDSLRDALLKLPATGAEGFEGLLSVTLTEITGIPFRLAGSGSQFGVDGKATYAADAVCFEAKRYDGNIPRTEILAKVAELSIEDKGDIDLWILGATSQVRTQLVDDVRDVGQKAGIATLILDWSGDSLPPLGIALAMSETPVSAFLGAHIDSPTVASRAIAALAAIRNDDAFADRAARIRSLLLEPTTGAGLAKTANAAWLTEVFSDKRQAKRFLHQALAPGDAAAGKPAARDILFRQLEPLLTGMPDGKIAALLGDEGVGKSWLIAQSWLSLKEKPLTIIFTADDFGVTSASDGWKSLLIDKLVAQTGGRPTEATRNWWHRKLDRWRSVGKLDDPSLVVIIDGLNQRPQTDWGHILDAMSVEIEPIGGRLIITARSAYYSSRVKPRLLSPTIDVNVPEWTDEERKAILAARGIADAKVRPQVAASLRNPRLLGIALELLKSVQIQELEELSVSRLLFEHMRIQERDAHSPRPAHEFARTLQDHAREILNRVGGRQQDDIKVFDGALEAVSDGRFFVPIKGDPTRYSLDEDSLPLALGFAIRDELRKALRNKRDLDDTLKATIEPISALDRTADAVLAALTIACLDDDCPIEIGTAIVDAFAGLQNLNDDDFSAFAGLALKRPDVFMHAARRVCLTSERQPNFDWIETALLQAKKVESAWSTMSPLIQAWLGHYSLSPEIRMFSHPSRDPVEKVEAERRQRQDKIDGDLSVLSTSERMVMSALIREDSGSIAALTRLAMKLIAGKPVAPFATALAHWSFANALNPDIGAPYKEFRHLVTFNRTDWHEAREAILRTCRVYEGIDVSDTGKWALEKLLMATGDPDDAARAQALIDKLTADREKFGGWRRVETYCATDPCNPKATKPENVVKTAEAYAAVDVSKLRLHMGQTSDDHFFEMARQGIARFEPHVGIEKHREFISNLLVRKGFPLRQGVFESRKHNALVTREHAEQLVEQLKAGIAEDGANPLSEKERWIVAQYHLLLAFPLLSATEQIAAVLSKQTGEDLLVELLDSGKPLDESRFEALLDEALREDNERSQYFLLAFALSTATPISQNVRANLPALTRSASKRIRAQAMGLVASISDEAAIKAVVKSGWSASEVTDRNGHEIWYGSCVILEAAARGMIPHREAIRRIAPELYGRTAKRLGGDAAKDVAALVDSAIRRAASLELDLPVPDIEMAQCATDGTDPPRYSAGEKANEPSDLKEAFDRLSESNKAFEQRQKRIHEAFETFRATLSREKANIIIDRLQIGEFEAIVAADSKLAQSWFDLFVNLSKPRLAAIHNLGLLLAFALADSNPDQAVQLITKLAGSEPLIHWTFGPAGIPFEAITLWSIKDHPAIEVLRFDRLDRAGNDADLGLEVLAALWNGKYQQLRAYIESRLQLGKPAEIARALMVAGLSDKNEFNSGVLARYRGIPGFIGAAQSAAIYAYERNDWSEHWLKEMRETDRPEDFWRYSMLFSKIADGRSQVMQQGNRANGAPFSLYWPSVKSQLKHRCEKWHNERKKKLFGDDAPSEVFLAFV